MEIIDRTAQTHQICAHAPAVAVVPQASACEECGSRFNLRSCAHCGHVGCCESQAGHARAHALGEGHPVIEQMTVAGPGFAWCYTDHGYVR